MIKTTVLLAPALTQVASSAPVAAVFALVPTATLDYPFPLVDWLLDVRGLHACYVEQVVISDAYSASVEKAESDLVSISDAHLYDLALGKVDVVSFPDQFDRTCDFYRDFSEIVGFSDAQTISLGKPLIDGIGISDRFSAQTSKAVSDGVGFSESQFTKSMTKVHTETVGFSDSFFLNGNSYSDVSYFAEDYVGAFRQV